MRRSQVLLETGVLIAYCLRLSLNQRLREAFMTLENMRPGHSCRVIAVHGEGSTYQRLLEMGLIENTVIRVIRHAPLGDPMEVGLHGYYLSLRKAEAAMVEVAHA